MPYPTELPTVLPYCFQQYLFLAKFGIFSGNCMLTFVFYVADLIMISYYTYWSSNNWVKVAPKICWRVLRFNPVPYQIFIPFSLCWALWLFEFFCSCGGWWIQIECSEVKWWITINFDIYLEIELNWSLDHATLKAHNVNS